MEAEESLREKKELIDKAKQMIDKYGQDAALLHMMSLIPGSDEYLAYIMALSQKARGV